MIKSNSPFKEENLKDTSKIKEKLKNQIALLSTTQIIEKILSEEEKIDQEDTINLILNTKKSQEKNIFNSYKKKNTLNNYQNTIKFLEEREFRTKVKKFQFIQKLKTTPSTSKELSNDKFNLKKVTKKINELNRFTINQHSQFL